MRCAICNAVLSPAEIQWNNDHKDWDPCNKCQEVIDEVFTDLSEEEIDEELAVELGSGLLLGTYGGDENDISEESS